MTEPRVALDQTLVKVDPGGRATVSVRILNPTQIVEAYVVDVVGECADWVRALPAEVSVFPGDETGVELSYEPPASNQVRAGATPFGVRVRSTVDADNATVAEGHVEVGAFRNVTATIGPKTSKGRRSGRHHVEISNWGNEPVTVALEALDPDEELKFRLDPQTIELPVGRGVSVDVRVKAGRTFLRGAPQRKPFSVHVRREGFAPGDAGAIEQQLDVAFEQRPLVPGWVIGLGALAIAATALVVYLRPDRKTDSEVGEAAPGAPPTPEGFAVTAGDDGLTARWQAVAGATGYEIVPVDADGATFEPINVGGGDTTARTFTADEAPPGEESCFLLRSGNDAGLSAATGPQCATAPAGPDTTGPGGAGGDPTTTTGGPGSGDPGGDPGGAGGTTSTSTGGTGQTNEDDLGFIAVEQSFPVDDAGSTQRAEAERARLQSEGIQAAAVLNSLDYDGVPDGPDGRGLLVVYVGGFPSRDAAARFCTDELNTTCAIFQPGPRNPSQPAVATTSTTGG